MSTNDKKIKYEKLTESDYDSLKNFKKFVNLEKYAKIIAERLGYTNFSFTKKQIEYWYDYIIDNKWIINNKNFKEFQKRKLENKNMDIMDDKSFSDEITKKIEQDGGNVIIIIIVVIVVIPILLARLIYNRIYKPIKDFKKQAIISLTSSLSLGIKNDILKKSILLGDDFNKENITFIDLNSIKEANKKTKGGYKKSIGGGEEDKETQVKKIEENAEKNKVLINKNIEKRRKHSKDQLQRRLNERNKNKKNNVQQDVPQNNNNCNNTPNTEKKPSKLTPEEIKRLEQDKLINRILTEITKPAKQSFINKINASMSIKKSKFRSAIKFSLFKNKKFEKIIKSIGKQLKEQEALKQKIKEEDEKFKDNLVNASKHLDNIDENAKKDGNQNKKGGGENDLIVKKALNTILNEIFTDKGTIHKNINEIFGIENNENIIEKFKNNNQEFFNLFLFDLFEGSIVDAVIYEVNLIFFMALVAIEKNGQDINENDIKQLGKFDINKIVENCKKAIEKKISLWFSSKKINLDILTKKMLLLVIKDTFIKVSTFITTLRSETLLKDIFNMKEGEDICDSIPFFVLGGLPYRINLKVNEAIKKIKQLNAFETHDNLFTIKKMFCLDLIQGLIGDFLVPFKKIIKVLIEDLVIPKINLLICLEDTTNTQDEEACREIKENIPIEKKKLKKKIINELFKKSGGGTDSSLVGGAVIGEGSYGCVFKPPIGCDGNEQLDLENSQYVSKLLIDYKWKIKREFEISNIIKTIPNYENSFGPLLSLCFIDVAKLNVSKENKDNCSLIKDKKSTKYVSALSKIKYIDLYHFDEIISIHTPKVNLMYFIKIYQSLLESISSLIKKRIVHYDLHSGNIVFDKKNDRPMIIDFGMAFKVDKMIKIDKIFFKDALVWTAWPLEAHFIGFILNLKRKLTDDEVVKIVDTFVEKHKIFTLYKNKISSKKIRLFKEKSLTYLRKLNKLPIRECVKKVIVTSWKTWDNYSISILFLKYLFYLKPTNILSKTFIKRFFNILFKNISPDVSKRSSVKKTYEKFKKLLNSQNFNNNFNRNVNIKAFDAFKRNIIKQHNEDISISQHIKNNI